MLTDQEASHLLTNTFFFHAQQSLNQISPDARFAHYTSAEVAMQIIAAPSERRSIWLRNATEMNDFSEVEFGQKCLQAALADEVLAARLQAAFEAIHPGILPRAFNLISDEMTRIKSGTYLLSLAMHDGAALDRGVLSMWRAYGGAANVCLLLNTAPLLNPQTAYGSYISPVFYGGSEGFKEQILAVIERVEKNRDLLCQLDPADVLMNFKAALDAAILSTKHPSFEEEREWRVIYRPPADQYANDLPNKIVSVGGIVQRIYHIPMQNVPEKGVIGAELDEILFRILIGPTPNPPLVRDAFVQLLRDAGVNDPENRVITSNVPLRR